MPCQPNLLPEVSFHSSTLTLILISLLDHSVTPRHINVYKATSQLAQMNIARASSFTPPASPTKAPTSPTKAATKCIYMHCRNLRGIIKSFETPMTVSGSEDELPLFEGLGLLAD